VVWGRMINQRRCIISKGVLPWQILWFEDCAIGATDARTDKSLMSLRLRDSGCVPLRYTWITLYDMHHIALHFICFSLIMIVELLLWLWTYEICECLTICVEVQVVMFYSCSVVFEWGLLGWVDILLHVVVMEVQLDEIGVLVFYIAYFVFSGLLVEYCVIWYSFPCFYTWVG